jgi:hypothetical protein
MPPQDPDFSNLNKMFTGQAPIKGEPYIPGETPAETYLTPLSDMPGISGVIQPGDIPIDPLQPRNPKTIELQTTRRGHLDALFSNRSGYLAVPEPKDKADLAKFIKPLPGSKLTLNETLILDSLGMIDDSYILPETMQKFIDDRKLAERWATNPETRNTLLNLIGGYETADGTVKPGVFDYFNTSAEALGAPLLKQILSPLPFAGEKVENIDRYSKDVIQKLVNWASGNSNETFDELVMDVSKTFEEERGLVEQIGVSILDPVPWLGLGAKAIKNVAKPLMQQAEAKGLPRLKDAIEATSLAAENMLKKDIFTTKPTSLASYKHKYVNEVLRDLEEVAYRNKDKVEIGNTLTSTIDESPDFTTKVIDNLNTGKTQWYDKFHALTVLNDFNIKQFKEMGIDMPLSYNTENMMSRFRGLESSVLKRVQLIQEEAKSIVGGEQNLGIVGELMTLRHMKDVLKMYSDRAMSPELTTQVTKIIQNIPQLHNSTVVERALKDMERELGSEMWDKANRAADVFIEDIRATFYKAVNAGEINRELANELIEKYPNYNPILYVDEYVKGQNPAEDAFTSVNQLIGKLTEVGSTGLRIDPISSHVFYTLSMEKIHQQNQIIKAIVRGAERFRFDGGLTGDFIKRVKDKGGPVKALKAPQIEFSPETVTKPRKMISVEADKIQPASSVKAIKTVQEIIDGEEMKKQIFIKADEGLNQISFLANNGKKYIYDVHPKIYQAVQDLTNGNLDDTMKLLGVAKDGGYTKIGTGIQKLLIDYNPKTLMRLLMGDELQASTMHNIPYLGLSDLIKLKVPKTTIANSFYKTMKSLFTKDKEFDNFILAGGDVIGYYGKKPGQMMSEYAKNVAKNKPSMLLIDDKIGKEIFNIKNWEKIWMKIAHRSELSPRVAVDLKSIEEGVHPLVAVQLAREVTGDFAKQGKYGQAANKIWWFLNPTIQGMTAPIRKLVKPQGTVGHAYQKFIGAHVVAYMLNREEPSYWQQSPKDRYAGLHLVIGAKNKDGVPILDENNNLQARSLGFDHWLNYISGPIIYALETLDVAAKEQLGKDLAGLDLRNDEVEQIIAAADFGKWLGGAANPIGSATGRIFDESILQPAQSAQGAVGAFMPSILKWPNEWFSNSNLYTGQKIVPQELENKKPEDQYDESTSPTAVRLGKWLGQSPMKIEHLLQTGSFREVLLAADNSIRIITGAPSAEVTHEVEIFKMLSEANSEPELSKEKIKFWSKFKGNNKLEQQVRNEIKRNKRISNIPFIGSTLEYFYSQTSNLSFIAAVAELEEDSDYSGSQTLEASKRINRYMDTEYYPEMDMLDNGFFNYQKDTSSTDEYIPHPDDDSIFITKGISPKQWIAGRALENTQLIAVIQGLDITGNLPRAIQSNDDPNAYSNWIKAVHDIANKNKDPNQKFSTLGIGYKAIPVYSKATGQQLDTNVDYADQVDWDRRRRDQKAYLEPLSEKDQQDVLEYINRNKTEVEKIYTKDQEEYLNWWYKVVDYEIAAMDTKGSPQYVKPDRNGHNVRWHYEQKFKKSGNELNIHKDSHIDWIIEDGVRVQKPVLNILDNHISDAREKLITGEYENPLFIKEFKSPSDSKTSLSFKHKRERLGANLDYKRTFWGYQENPKLDSTKQRLRKGNQPINKVSNIPEFIQKSPPQLPENY